jgi:short-subunit dehydrogenase
VLKIIIYFRDSINITIMTEKVSIITGSSSGIGKAISYEIASKGSNVVLVARRKDKLIEYAKDIEKKYHVETLVIQADLSIQEECKKVIDKTIEKFNKLDILINNAGISQRAMFADLDLSVIHKVMNINYWASVYTTKYALPYLLKTKGSVVAISSISGFSPLPARTGYCSSKYALHGFMESLRIEHLKTGVHVMIAAPEYVASEIREHALIENGQEQGKSPREEKKMLTAEYVAKRIVKGISKRRRTMVIGKMGTLNVILYKMLPKLTDKLIYNYIKRETNSPY